MRVPGQLLSRFTQGASGLSDVRNLQRDSYKFESGWHLEHTIEQRTQLMTAKFDRLCDGLRIPTCRHSGSKQRLDLRSDIQSLLIEGVKERLDAKTVTSRE